MGEDSPAEPSKGHVDRVIERLLLHDRATMMDWTQSRETTLADHIDHVFAMSGVEDHAGPKGTRCSSNYILDFLGKLTLEGEPVWMQLCSSCEFLNKLTAPSRKIEGKLLGKPSCFDMFAPVAILRASRCSAESH